MCLSQKAYFVIIHRHQWNQSQRWRWMERQRSLRKRWSRRLIQMWRHQRRRRSHNHPRTMSQYPASLSLFGGEAEDEAEEE